jgi:hypothetical protein
MRENEIYKVVEMHHIVKFNLFLFNEINADDLLREIYFLDLKGKLFAKYLNVN